MANEMNRLRDRRDLSTRAFESPRDSTTDVERLRVTAQGSSHANSQGMYAR